MRALPFKCASLQLLAAAACFCFPPPLAQIQRLVCIGGEPVHDLVAVEGNRNSHRVALLDIGDTLSAKK